MSETPTRKEFEDLKRRIEMLEEHTHFVYGSPCYASEPFTIAEDRQARYLPKPPDDSEAGIRRIGKTPLGPEALSSENADMI